ncbi:hypothetical protein TNCV_1398281 [Trichonephila clavipes]|nr:hypothetical protein TNCV_1398281 [Trichonephila clavipes]
MILCVAELLEKIEEEAKNNRCCWGVRHHAHSVVSRLWKSFKTTGMCSRRHGEVMLKKADLPKNCARRLRGGGLIRTQTCCVSPIDQTAPCTARLQWCREHQYNWTEQDWAWALFSDESRFSLSSSCRRQLIWRKSGTQAIIQKISRKRTDIRHAVSWCGPGIMINGRTRLHVVANGTMTGQRYIDIRFFFLMFVLPWCCR